MSVRQFFKFTNREFIAAALALSLSAYSISLKINSVKAESEKKENTEYYQTQLNTSRDYCSQQLENTRRSSEVSGCYEGIRQNCLMYSKKADVCFQKLAEICPSISQ
ncbi:MAG TPA: hypothetical protein PKI14_01485 [Fervidobacterium sp.]|nr:hypothetical protein [Fervidobacterium sp.]